MTVSPMHFESKPFAGTRRLWQLLFLQTDSRSQKGLGGRLRAWFDAAQGWILVAIIGFITALIAYFVDVTETAVFDIKEGYCTGKTEMLIIQS